MKKLILFIIIVFNNSVIAQVTLKDCIQAGLQNKVSLKTARTEVLISNLKLIENKAKYLPQISIAFDYRFNPIIPSQIVPIGQFNPIPTNDTRAIQFGTNWQQNSGISLYQPLLDFNIQSRIKEAKLYEKLMINDLKESENEFIYELVKTYNNIILFELQLNDAANDSLRSYETWKIIELKYKEGVVLKNELNNSIINHNLNIINYNNKLGFYIREKIYLNYLTGINLNSILDQKFAQFSNSLLISDFKTDTIIMGSNLKIEKLNLQEEILRQELITEKTKYTPSIGLIGFLGVNQFTQEFNLFETNSYYGNSYLGLSLKFQLFSPDKGFNIEKQIQNKALIINYKREDLKSEITNQIYQKNNEINNLFNELKILEYSVQIQKENIKIFKDRLNNGQSVANDLNNQEIELQKLLTQVNQTKEKYSKALIDKLYISGVLLNQINFL